jgi:hypothetical protein
MAVPAMPEHGRDARGTECTENPGDISVVSVPYLCDLCENPSLFFFTVRENS